MDNHRKRSKHVAFELPVDYEILYKQLRRQSELDSRRIVQDNRMLARKLAKTERKLDESTILYDVLEAGTAKVSEANDELKHEKERQLGQIESLKAKLKEHEISTAELYKANDAMKYENEGLKYENERLLGQIESLKAEQRQQLVRRLKRSAMKHDMSVAAKLYKASDPMRYENEGLHELIETLDAQYSSSISRYYPGHCVERDFNFSAKRYSNIS